MDKETWKEVFCRQVSTGKFWKNLFKDEFDKHQFLDRSDAVYIGKKAQADIYEAIIAKLDNNEYNDIFAELKQELADHWKVSSDDSALGMVLNGKQIK